ncbi:MAG: phospho-N-acetylmuramoyl-pentapeptide-transferase [Candidatus Liptonbacteria bacterium]|nr:phospho-N-acetylmuramoyl-pentapeptide-transferase [Candidatus Liptonbacteria bacterium]
MIFSQGVLSESIPGQAIRVIILTGIAFLVALLATPFWYRLIKRYQMRKQIRTRSEAPVFHKFHQKKEGTPTAGGVIIWSTVLLLAIVFGILNYFFDGFWGYLNFIDRAQTYLPLAALIIAAILGLLDDWLGVLKIGSNGGGLKIRYKLLVYTVAALIGAWWFYFKLDWTVIYVPFLGTIEVGWLNIPIFIFIIVASAFSANETDGLDGLLGGVSLFAFVALTTVAFVLGRYDLAAFGGVTIGALLAFLWFNIYPARFFMGDTGSMSLGITIGVIAMLTNTVLLLPFFGIILVAESLSVIAQMISKKTRGKKIFLSTPIHHHFEALGWPESQVTMRFWIISAVFSAFGLVIFFLAKFF